MNKFYLYFAFVMVFVSVSFGQSRFRINLESGYLYSDADLKEKLNELLTRVDVKYRYQFSKFKFDAKVQPGFLGFGFEPKSLKIKSELKYLSKFGNLNYGVDMAYQLHNYFEDDTHKLDIFSVSTFGSVMLSENFDLMIRINYNKQNTEFFESQEIDRVNISILTHYYHNRYFHLNAGVFAENFFIESNSNRALGVRNKNDGYRVGPVLSLNYTKNFIVRANYRYLFQKGDLFDQTSSEHNFRFVAGKLLNETWSIFLLIDYTQPVYNFELEKYNDKNLLYISSNYENNYYLKIAHKLSKKFSLYTKLGYFNESIKYLGYDFKGWNCMLGIEIR